MVLIRTTLLALLMAACMPKKVLLQAPTDARIAVATLFNPMDSRTVVQAPAELTQAVSATVTAAGFAVTPVEAASLATEFESRRGSLKRAAFLAQQEPEHEFLGLVETQARYFSQLNGLFRWEVDVRVTLRVADDAESAITDTFTVPVFLRFQHEGEEEAVSASAGMIDRRLRRKLGEFVGGLGAR